MKKITVILVDDHKIVREGFLKLLEAEGDVEVLGEAADGREAVQLAQKLRPVVVVMDVAMPQMNGLESTRQILTANPSTRVIMLSAHSDPAYVEQAFAAGAAGYLLKQASSDSLCEAIRRVQTTRSFLFPPGCAELRRALLRQRAKPVSKQNSGLSSREIEVLQLIAEGKPNKQTAAELGISIKTVEKHRQRLMKKLGIHDTAGLTRHAISAGIIESSVQRTTV